MMRWIILLCLNYSTLHAVSSFHWKTFTTAVLQIYCIHNYVGEKSTETSCAEHGSLKLAAQFYWAHSQTMPGCYQDVSNCHRRWLFYRGW